MSVTAGISPAPVPAGGLRERKKAQTREALGDAALQLFNDRGFEQTTVEDIAEACDVSPRTFFRYFRTKEDVLFAESDERCGRLLTTIAAEPRGTAPLQAVLAGSLAVAEDYGAERDRLIVRKRVLSSSPDLRASSAERQRGWEDAVAQLLTERAEARGDAASGYELRLLAATSLAALRVALDEWLAAEEYGDLPAIVRDAFGRIGRGFDAAT
jgi:AcrR family transcriptional regulator